MDAVFEAQFRMIRQACAREGKHIDVALRPGGEAAYAYQAERLLVLDRGDNVARIRRHLPGVYPVDETAPGDLVVLATDRLDDGRLTVPEALETLRREVGAERFALDGSGLPLASPVHVLHLSRLCMATEPETPNGAESAPWPPPCSPPEGGHEVRVAVVDSGLMENFDEADYPWMTGVTGEPDPLGPVSPGTERLIEGYTGHGTFVAGVVKCMAPSATVAVSNVFANSGAELETEVVAALDRVVAAHDPHIVNLSAGTYTQGKVPSLAFETFHAQHPGVVMVAPAGNDATSAPFYPAAYDWVVSVGALGADRRHRAWFSNYGDTVDVYALGEAHVNAYTSGTYVYNEPPKASARQDFTGLARWSGTSFSAPLVAGLIASRMARTGESAQAAADAVRDTAAMQAIPGIGPALHPCDEP
ncbi:S8 family peptidase [Actinomadura fibrosa]|uniref:S8 family serine peptidase n=1 Tax=Actinomadura fibrosa TaxID=111802 RepID=A0ABW2XN86_9ACTN|nr:S8/S53 family peptidase [Actinomadura fibrosa]